VRERWHARWWIVDYVQLISMGDDDEAVKNRGSLD
jgi:hypothetical protein